MKKYLDFCCFVNLYDFLSLKNDVNVLSKRNKHKKLREFVFFGGMSRIQSPIR
jgi:hypothetical protein